MSIPSDPSPASSGELPIIEACLASTDSASVIG
jgi:hypothetical protein